MRIHRIAVFAIAVAGVLSAPATAGADTVVRKEGNVVVIDGGIEQSELEVAEYGGGPVVADHNAPVVAGAGCAKTSPITVVCNGAYELVLVKTNGGSDSIRVTNPSAVVPTSILGGPGFDTIEGAGERDSISGGSENDTLTGGGGDDDFVPGLGQDTVVGGTGLDRVSYQKRTRPVSVTFDNLANDGTENENDSISNIEGASGGSANDRLIGDSAANTFDGREGDDLMRGGAGDDRFEGSSGYDTVSYADRSAPVVARIDDYETSGADGERDLIREDVENLTGGSAADVLFGQDGTEAQNVLRGGSGDDSLVAGAAGTTSSGRPAPTSCSASTATTC